MNLVLVRIWKNIYNDKKRIPASLLAFILALIVKRLKISVEKDRVITHLNLIKH